MQGHIVLKPSLTFNMTVSSTAVALPAPDNDVTKATLVVEAADIRMRWEPEADPTTTTGIMMLADSIWPVEGRDKIVNMRFIRATATDARISGSYEKGE